MKIDPVAFQGGETLVDPLVYELGVMKRDVAMGVIHCRAMVKSATTVYWACSSSM
jgi:hypothetical protein